MRGTWQSTDSGGGGTALVVLAVVIAAGSGAASAAVSALMTIVIVLGSVAVTGAAAGIGVLIWRARSERPGRPLNHRAEVQRPPESRPVLSSEHKTALSQTPECDRRAIEPPQLHLHFHGLSPAEVAEAIRQAGDRK